MRYDDCIDTDGGCYNCSLCSFGRDCHNNPANHIAYLRCSAGLTQQELADKAGVNLSLINKLENGYSKVDNITLKNAVALADALGVDARELL